MRALKPWKVLLLCTGFFALMQLKLFIGLNNNKFTQLQWYTPRAHPQDDDHCLQILPGFNLTNWPDVIYHKDQHGDTNHKGTHDHHRDTLFNRRIFSSVEEEDAQARSTIAEFNKMRSSVLTPELIDSGIAYGDKHRARKFARRLMESSRGEGHALTIAVFGSSFTSGNSCAESSSQAPHHCSWPYRLNRRWKEVIAPLFCKGEEGSSSCEVRWRMFQEGTQGSVRVAQKLHFIFDEFSSHPPDAILLDNSIIDTTYGDEMKKPWFEAVVKALVERYPHALVVSLVDAIPPLVNTQNVRGSNFLNRVHEIQKCYGLAKVDLAQMVRILANNSSIDLLWPQSPLLIASNGTKVPNGKANLFSAAYWDNFLPKVQVMKNGAEGANPNNHPPWPTHQFVADIVLYSLLRIVEFGLECNDSEATTLPICETVASNELIDNCFICLDPISQFDAKSSRYFEAANKMNNGDPHIEICGDFGWKTDDRNRSGWQSDIFGSLIRFRLKLSEEKPFVSMTYMTSYSTFGSLQVLFQTAEEEDERPSIRCDNVLNKTEHLPWIEFPGSRTEYSLWESFTFSADQQPDLRPFFRRARDMFNNTVLSQENAKYADLYVYNPNKNGDSRIKIQTVTSC